MARLLERTVWHPGDLRRAVVEAIASLEGRMRNSPRDVSMITTTVTLDPAFETVNTTDVRDVLIELAHTSRGMLHLTDDDKVSVHCSLEELRRRLANHVETNATPRRKAPFRT